MRHLLLQLKSISIAVALLTVPVVVIPSASDVAGATTPATPWQVHLNGEGTSAFQDVSCPSSQLCVAVGGGPNGRASIFRSSNGGTRWSRENTPALTESLGWISCPSVVYCLAAGRGPYEPFFLASSDGGITWLATGGSFGRDDFYIQALSCGSTSICVAASGQGFYRSNNGGATWVQPTTNAAGNVGPNSLACPSATICFAVAGSRVLKSHNGGVSFSVIATVPVGQGPLSISCASTIRCAAAGLGPSGRVVMWTVDGGAKWNSNALPPSLRPIAGVSCVGAGTCTVVTVARNPVNRTVLVAASTSDRGAKWTAHSITSLPAIYWPDVAGGLACTAGGACFVDGFGIPTPTIFSSAKAGAAWHRVGVTVGLPPLATVACPTSQLCVAMGEQGLVMRSLDGGSTWSSSGSQLNKNAYVESLACSSATNCVAVGYVVHVNDVTLDQASPAAFRSTDGGVTWAKSVLPAGVARLAYVTCASATVCLAVPVNDRASFLRTVNGGATWKTLQIPNSDRYFVLGDISCGSATDCVAVGATNRGGTSFFSTDAGASWGVVAAPAGLHPEEVSCTTALTCFALGYTGEMAPGVDISGISKTVDGGKHWTAQSAPTTWNEMAIACVSTGCEELATTSANYGALVSTVSTGIDGPTGLDWSTATLQSADVVLNGMTYGSSGRWIVVGSNAVNGPLILTSS